MNDEDAEVLRLDLYAEIERLRTELANEILGRNRLIELANRLLVERNEARAEVEKLRERLNEANKLYDMM